MSLDKPVRSRFRGKAFGLSIVGFILMLLVLSGVIGFTWWESSKAEAAKKPQLIAKTLYKEIMDFRNQKARFPKDFEELNSAIWEKTGKRIGGELYGANDYRYANYLYIYYGEDHVASLWCIPQGESAENFNPTYLLITPVKFDLWKGAYFKKSDERLIPRKPVPNQAEMASLAMVKQQTKTASARKKKAGMFGF